MKTKELPIQKQTVAIPADSVRHAELILKHDPLGFDSPEDAVEYALRDYLTELTKAGHSVPAKKEKK